MGILDAAGRIVYANAAARRLVGPELGGPGTPPIWRFVVGAGEPEWRARWEALQRERSAVFETHLQVPGGGALPVEVAATLMDRAGGAVAICAVRDLTDRRRAEEAYRLAGVGTLAAGVAHEVNNPLAYVIANVQVATERIEALAGADPAAAAEVTAALRDAGEGAARVREVVRGLRVFSREPENTPPEPVDLAGVLRSAVALAESELRQRARLVVQLEPGLPPVLGSEGRLVQVLVNLLVNAAQAIPEGHAHANEVRVSARRAGRSVVLEVVDTGEGMTAEVQARAFQPFFTTRPVGAGTGLGLSICLGIVTGLGGSIELESAPGKGSTFRVALPAAGAEAVVAPAFTPAPAAVPVQPEPPPPAQAEAEPPTPGPGTAEGKLRVLVVDDDRAVARAMQRMLAGAFEVELASSGAEALQRLGTGARFDVVLCDLMMPEMTGMELHGLLEVRAPEVARRMVFLTGGAFTARAGEFLERVPNARLEKPFGADDLRRLVREVAAA
ncbi:MAG: ATP-binding protein [Anaeromyxobacter sp.]